ncbi:MAG: glycosyltransferase [Phycisphaerae bacterium]|nr:glycosyltransferase [Phycisphaerae bacterium]
MKILVIFEHVETDPGRVTFYNRDVTNQYLKANVIKLCPGSHAISNVVNLFLTAVFYRMNYRKFGIDLIVSGNPRIGFFVGAINRLTYARTKHVVWDFNIQKQYGPVIRYLARYALAKVEAVVVYSSHEKKIYAKMLSLPEDKVLFKLYSGPYLEDKRYNSPIKRVKKEYIISAGCSGRDYRYLAKIAKEMVDVKFVVLAYSRALQGISFTSNVQVITGISEIEYCRYIAQARLMVLPIANKETANGHIAVVQAMSLKTLLVVNMTKGVEDYLQPGENCLVIPDDNVEFAVQQIRAALANETRDALIIENAHTFANLHFTIRNDVRLIGKITDAMMKGQSLEKDLHDLKCLTDQLCVSYEDLWHDSQEEQVDEAKEKQYTY